MTIREDLDKLKITPKTLREFGWLVGGIFCALAAWGLWRGSDPALFFLIPGIPLLTAAFLVPGRLASPYKAWMLLAFVMGWVMTRFLLTVLFFFIVLPISITARVTGTKFLDLESDRDKLSYWQKKTRVQSADRYEKQF